MVGYEQVTKIHEIDEFFHALVVLRVESYEIWIEITLRDVTIKTSDTRVTIANQHDNRGTTGPDEPMILAWNSAPSWPTTEPNSAPRAPVY